MTTHDRLALLVRVRGVRSGILLHVRDEVMSEVLVNAEGIPLLRREQVARALRELADRIDDRSGVVLRDRTGALWQVNSPEVEDEVREHRRRRGRG